VAKILTQAALDAFEPVSKRREVPDAKAAGLYHVIRPSGARSWALRYRFGGKSAKLTIGPYPEIGLAEARNRATRARAQIAGGDDPAQAKL
jgi:hypothetical protein